MLREVKKKILREKEPKVMIMRLRMTPMSSPLSLLTTMERGLLKRRLATNLTPRRATKPLTSNKVGLPLMLLPNTNKE
jgi:hypothetical protein